MEVREPSAKYLSKAAYKQTEVGMIPEDWNCLMLRDCCNKVTDGTHDTPTPVRSGVPFLTAIHVKDNKIDFDACLYLSEADHEVIYSRCNPERGDVLFVNIGAGVATTALVDVNFQFSLKNVALLKPNSRAVSGHYLNYALSNTKTKIIRDLSSGGAQPFLSLTQIGAIAIPLPSTLDEQQAIAEALSDADALIESLDQLLAKKRQIKQGAMQELLTGQKRLPGFSGKWEVKKLGELVEIRKGELITEANAVLGSIPVIAGGKRPAYFHNVANRLGKTITISGSGASAGFVAFYDIPIFSSDCSTIGEGASYVIEFVYFALSLNQNAIYKAQTGGAQPHIHPHNLWPMPIAVPETKAEQTAIATLLSDMDAEIAALEARLAKARLLKQGMMQELLTGRIRLI